MVTLRELKRLLSKNDNLLHSIVKIVSFWHIQWWNIKSFFLVSSPLRIYMQSSLVYIRRIPYVVISLNSELLIQFHWGVSFHQVIKPYTYIYICYISFLTVGRWALLPVVGHWNVHCLIHWLWQLWAAPGGRPLHRQSFHDDSAREEPPGHTGSPRSLVPQLLRSWNPRSSAIRSGERNVAQLNLDYLRLRIIPRFGIIPR